MNIQQSQSSKGKDLGNSQRKQAGSHQRHLAPKDELGQHMVGWLTLLINLIGLRSSQEISKALHWVWS